MVSWIVVGIAAYILGSIPSGLWISRKIKDIDIRDYGSKNTGATNVFRILGWQAAAVVFLMDSIKGALSVWLGIALISDPLGALLGGLLALVGHSYSCFMNFSGGRGVATGVGVLAGLMPGVALCSFMIWFITVAITRYVSLGSILGALAAPILAWYFYYPNSYQIFALATALLVILRHGANIKRLIKGTESKVGRISVPKAEDDE